MGVRDPTVPQSDDPDLAADLIRLLRIVGPLGRLSVADVVIPVVSMGDVATRTITVLQPAFRSTDLFSAGLLVAAAVDTVHADTGPLAEGTYDVVIHISPQATTNMFWRVVHRDAADAATLMEYRPAAPAGASGSMVQTFGYELALNERLRITNTTAFAAGEGSSAWIFLRRRT